MRPNPRIQPGERRSFPRLTRERCLEGCLDCGCMETTSHGERGWVRRLTSEYLLPPLETQLRAFHRVSLAPGPTGSSRYDLMLDPNFCTLDEYGEPLGCTRIALFHYGVQLEALSREGTQTLYAIESRELPARFRLVVIDKPLLAECPARLLMINDDNRIIQLVHLHPTDLALGSI